MCVCVCVSGTEGRVPTFVAVGAAVDVGVGTATLVAGAAVAAAVGTAVFAAGVAAGVEAEGL